MWGTATRVGPDACGDGREAGAGKARATHQQLGAGEGQEGAQVHRPSTDAAIRHLRQGTCRRQRQQPAHDGAQPGQHLGWQRGAAQDVGARVSVCDMQAWGRGVCEKGRGLKHSGR